MTNKRLNATITIGGAVSGSLKSALGMTRDKVNDIGKAITNLNARQRELNGVIKREEGLGARGSALRVQYANQELAVIGKQIAALKQRQVYAGRVQANRSAIEANQGQRANLRGQIFDAVAIGAAVASPIKSAVAFETAMLGVAKQVEGARDEGGKLTAVYSEMGRTIKQMAREIPLTTTELAEMVTAGARMGVARNELEKFTRTSAMMAEAFELPAGELAESMGKIAGLYKIPIPAIGELADAINYLDDNAISKGADIIDYLTRVGGVASSVKITSREMAALGSTLLTLGERTETAGTASNAMFQKFAAADKGTKKFKAAVKEIGLSTKEIQKGMQKDSMGTMLKVLDAIGKLDAEKQLGVMVELVGLEHSDTMAKLANNTAELRKQLALANSEAAKGSMAREFAARLETTAAKAKLARNQLSILSTNIGTVLLPAVNSVLKPIGSMSESMANFAEANPGTTKAVVGTAVALAGLGIGSKVAAYGFTFIKGGLLGIQGLFLRFGGIAAAALSPVGTLLRTVAVAALVAGAPLWGMVGAAVAVAAAVVGAGVLIYKYWEPLKAFFVGFGQGIADGLAPVGQLFTDAFGPIWKVIGPTVMPVLDTIGGWVKNAWQWFTDLFTPIEAASATTVKFGEAGKVCGEVIAGAFKLMLAPILAVWEAIKWINENIDGVIAKAAKVGEIAAKGFQGAKDFFTGKPQANAGQPTGPAPLPADADARPVGALRQPMAPVKRQDAPVMQPLAPVKRQEGAVQPGSPRVQVASLPNPTMATSRTDASVTDNRQYTFTIHQSPGQDGKATADEIQRRMRADQGARRGGALYDHAQGY